jgi:hypothetical protein
VTTLRIAIDDGEAYWNFPGALARTYERLSDDHQTELRQVLEGVASKFFLHLAGLTSVGDIEGLQRLDDLLRVLTEAALYRLQESRP